MRKLKKWVIVPTGVSSMEIEGRCAKTGAFVTTGDIQRRLSNCRVVATGGVCYQLSGYMDWNAGFEANVPTHILDSFMYGVPQQWKRIIYGWPPSAPGKRIRRNSTRKVKRRSSSRHGRLTPRVSVPGASCNDSELDGHRKYELSGEQTEQRSLLCGGPGTGKERAAFQAGRGEMSDNRAAEMRKENQLLLKNLRVILEPLPTFLGFKGCIEKSANKQICSTPVSVRSRPIRCSTRAGTLNQKRCTDCNEALVVPGMSSLSKQKEKHGQSTARVKTNDALVLVAEGAALSEVASCSWMQPPAPDLLGDRKVPARKKSGATMVTRLRKASCPALTQLGESCKAQAHIHSPSGQQSHQKASHSEEPNREMAAEPRTSVGCKKKKGKGRMTLGNLAMKTQQVHTSVCAATTATPRSSLRMMRRGSLRSAERGCTKEKRKQSKGRSPDTADRSRKHLYISPLKPRTAVTLFSSPPRREKQSTRSFDHGYTRSGCRYSCENTGHVSRNRASLARRKLDLRSSLNSGNGSQAFEDSCASELRKEAGCLKRHDRAKGQEKFAKQAATSSPKRLPRNRTQSDIYPKAKALNAEKTVKKRSCAVQRRCTRSVTCAENTFSSGEKANDAAQAKIKELRTSTGRTQRQSMKDKKGQRQRVSSVSCSSRHPKLPPEVEPHKTRAQTSQPNQVSDSAATEASLVIARKGTSKQKVQTSINKGTKKQDTFIAEKAASEVQKPPVSPASKTELSNVQASNHSVASTSATAEQLRKANQKRTPRVLNGPPVPDMADNRYPTRKVGTSKARAPKFQARTLKRKLGASAEEFNGVTGRKKPKEDDVREPAASASPRADKMGDPGLASKAVRSRKQAETSKLRPTSKTVEPVLSTAAARKQASRPKARVSKRNSAKECDTSINHKRPEANEALEPPAQSRLCATARANFELDEKARSSKMPANISNFNTPVASAAAKKLEEDKGQKPLLLLHRLRTSQTGDSQHSEVAQNEIPSKTRADTVKVGRATEVAAMQPLEALLPKVKITVLNKQKLGTRADEETSLKQKHGTEAEEPTSLLGQKKREGDNKSAEKLYAPTGRGRLSKANKAQVPHPSGSPEASGDQHIEPTLNGRPSQTASKLGGQAPTGRGRPSKANKAQVPPPSGSPEVSGDQHIEPTPKGRLSKTASKLGGQATGTAAALEAVHQGAVQRRARTSMKNCTEKQNGSAAQIKPRKFRNIHKSVNALGGEAGELGPTPPKSSQMFDLGQGSKFTAGDQVLAEKAVRKQTGRTSKTENAEQAVQRKPKRGRSKKDSEVQKPAPVDAENVRELAPEAGPSKNPASDVVTRPKKGGTVQKPACAESACESTPQAGPSRTPASNAGQAPKPSAFTAALLAITARKGTKKRKAQVKQLTEALAARDECDDMYAAGGAPLNIVCDFVDEDPWAEMSDLRLSSMGTPTPNSPHVSPGKSCCSFSSNHSGAMSAPPPFAHAILQGIKGRKPAAPLPSSTPKLARGRGKKHLSVSAVTKGLRELGEKMDRDKINANCAESSNESWDTDSSHSDKLPPLL